MPKIDVSEEQIVESREHLSPQARRDALRRLLPNSGYLDRAIERNQSRIEEIARRRGLEWNALTEEQREQLVDDVLHELLALLPSATLGSRTKFPITLKALHNEG